MSRRELLVLICCVEVAAQAPAPPRDAAQPDVVFRVTTSLVQVDAVVTDSKGHYIKDLTADDFEIDEDGKPQKITNCSYVQTGSQPKPRAARRERKSAPADVTLPPAETAPLRRQDVRRTIVLMVDDLGLSFESMALVRHALRKYIETQIQPGDLVAILRTGSGTGSLQRFTNDKRILLAAVAALRWNINNLRTGQFEPYGRYSDLAQKLAGSNQPPKANGKAGDTAQESTLASLNAAYDTERSQDLVLGTLGALNYVVDALREMPGRKSVVLFSDGAGFTYSVQLRDALRLLVDRANRAGTVIYTMLATGLQTESLDAVDRVGLTGMRPQQAQETLNSLTEPGVVGGRDYQYNMGRLWLTEIAAATGGVAYEPGNDLNWGLDRMLEDQQGYYLIGYKPAAGTFASTHGLRGYHRITVKVRRAGLHVRSRTGFFGATDEETRPKYATPIEQLHAAMISPFASSGVQLRLTALYTAVRKRGVVVQNLLHIDARDLTFRRAADGSWAAQAEILAVATGAGDRPVAIVAREYTFLVAADKLEQGLRVGALYTLDVPLKKAGPYQIHVAVRDAATGKVGSASQFLEIPDPKRARVALTSVVLEGAGPAGTAGRASMIEATREFHPGGQVGFFCRLERRGKRESAQGLSAQIRIVRDGREVYSGPAKLRQVKGGGFAITGKMKFSATMTPGDYYLGVIASDREARKDAMSAQWTDFEIRP